MENLRFQKIINCGKLNFLKKLQILENWKFWTIETFSPLEVSKNWEFWKIGKFWRIGNFGKLHILGNFKF